jgi:hypothetical protein
VTALLLALALAAASQATASAPPPPAVEDRPLVHVVLFTVLSSADADALIADSRRLLASIPGVAEVRVGKKALADREAHVKDYDVGLSVRMTSARDLAAYAAHPRHRELVEKWRGRATWKVIDFYGE